MTWSSPNQILWEGLQMLDCHMQEVQEEDFLVFRRVYLCDILFIYAVSSNLPSHRFCVESSEPLHWSLSNVSHPKCLAACVHWSLRSPGNAGTSANSDRQETWRWIRRLQSQIKSRYGRSSPSGCPDIPEEYGEQLFRRFRSVWRSGKRRQAASAY